MKRRAEVELRWLVDFGGSGTPPGRKYSAPARFDYQGENWGENAWSVIVTPNAPPDSHGRQSGVAEFLSSNAPQHWLSVGRKFTLFEGRRPVVTATVKRVLEES
jgi:hypothetical protein